MKRVKDYIRNHAELIFVLIVVAGIFLFVHFKQRNVKNEGVITVAKVTNYEGAESGSDLFIEIYLDNKIYSTRIGYGCGINCIGKFFFVKVNKNNPKDYPIFYGDKQVPDCILRSVKVYEGWEDFPQCP